MCVCASVILLPVVVVLVVYHLSLKALAPHKSTQIAFESYYLCLVPTVKYQKKQKVDGRRRREEAKTKAYRADPKILKHSRRGQGVDRKSLCTFLWHSLCCCLVPFAVVSFHVQFYFDCNNFLQQHFHLAKSLLLCVV